MTLALALRATPVAASPVTGSVVAAKRVYASARVTSWQAVTPASGAALAWLTGRCAGVVKNGRLPRRGSRSVSTRLHATKPEVAFVIGGPGSGKGTQCELVVSELGFQHLSAGELLRQERSRKGSPLAEEIEEAMKAAKPVPSEVIAKLLEQAMREAGAWAEGPAARFVVDGYPRSAEQLRGYQTELSQKVQLLCCISLEVDREEMRRRLLGRAQSSGRVDDEEEVIEKRLNTFQADTDPLLAFFKAEGLLKEVNGNQAPEQVFQEVRACLEVEADA
ncbi:UMP-CMP kinase (Deoxycytidylate kinase) (CK) (dCMP kinase) (Nucleoside-diphosphate kinase) (Uridine monophosphate/cytidine monophosphate kinase) (UMP/CMP kinase) (UMP/CMPK) [Durusdinium trenchii]|uniref:UMP-CMP kinase (Deoxycytidylate kinase) (CK) (dCMP kinase) (Nucleoside-diphosphate kinase) (Uridine monophosphate/cytidine monophosphate kinase) (UMP/CMP kinase) (UMP/CMPK) n=1 Tax=Durusdinium trenchii TaxID=1381693 RepID=A0ABP0P6E2_9DINO